MSKPAAAGPRSVLVGLARFVPAVLAFAAAAAAAHPLALILLLLGNALMLTAICAGIGFDMDSGFARSVARRGLAAFVLFSLYTVIVALLLAAPAWWLTRDPSLPAALALSAAALLAVLSLWRLWPAFALPFVWDDAYPEADQGSWLLAALRRSLAFARHLTGGHELFFTHGLPAALAVLAVCVGALALAGFGGSVGSELRISAFIVYGLAIVPLAHVVLATRCVNARLTVGRRRRMRVPATRILRRVATRGIAAAWAALELGSTAPAARSGRSTRLRSARGDDRTPCRPANLSSQV